MKRFKSKFAVLAVVIASAACSKNDTLLKANDGPASATKGVAKVNAVDLSKLKWDFQHPVLDSALHDLKKDITNTGDIAIVTDPVSSSSTNKVLKFTLATNSSRAEVGVFDPSTAPNNYDVFYYANSSYHLKNSRDMGSDIWFGGRIFKPYENGLNNNKASLLQIGPVTDADSLAVTGAGFFQLRLNTNNDNADNTTHKWNWRVFGNNYFTPASMNSDFNITQFTDGLPCTFKYGIWQAFVIHCKYSTNSDGIIEVWLSGKKISTSTFNASQANSINPNNRVRIKWGVYIGSPNKPTQPITCYFDDMKLGTSYNDVKPVW